MKVIYKGKPYIGKEFAVGVACVAIGEITSIIQDGGAKFEVYPETVRKGLEIAGKQFFSGDIFRYKLEDGTLSKEVYVFAESRVGFAWVVYNDKGVTVLEFIDNGYGDGVLTENIQQLISENTNYVKIGNDFDNPELIRKGAAE